MLRLSEALAKTIALPEVREKFARQGLHPATSNADEMTTSVPGLYAVGALLYHLLAGHCPYVQGG